MISLEHVRLHAGSFVLHDVSFSVPAGCYATLMGRTGSGKTTILEAIAGIAAVRSGRILLGGEDVTTWSPARRGVGYVPQDGALFSTMTVHDHLAFALTVRKWPRAAISERVSELATLLQVTSLLGRKPHGLSGGERQRVALGRALSFRPNILLLDEPLSAVDEEARGRTQELLKHVQTHEGITVLHVTHSTEEAKQLAHQWLRIENGAVTDVSRDERPLSSRDDGTTAAEARH